MATANSPVWHDPNYELRVTAFDRAVGLVLSLLIVIGCCVLALFLIWLTGQTRRSQVTVPVQFQPIGEGGLPTGPDLAVNTEDPGQEEDLEIPDLKDSLDMVADVVADRLTDLDNPLISDPESLERGGKKGAPNRGGGGSGGSGVRRRWEIFFDRGNTLDTYARQLDFFKIELGVLLPGGRIQYVSNFTQPRPQVREGRAEDEQRFYLLWQRGDLQQADRELLARAGIDPGNRPILKFLPPDVEAKLVALERAHAAGRANRISSTRFGIRRQGNGFAFYVISQQYR